MFYFQTFIVYLSLYKSTYQGIHFGYPKLFVTRDINNMKQPYKIDKIRMASPFTDLEKATTTYLKTL